MDVAYRDLLILKQQPSQLLAMQNRLNRKLNTISRKVVDRAMKEPLSDPSRYNDQVIEAYREHLTQIYKIGEMEVIRSPGVELTQSILSFDRLDRLIDERTFKASEYTMERLQGDVLSKIQEGIKEGQALEKTTESLKTEFVDMTQSQLQRISRTETHSTYNQAKYETMLQSQAVKGKRWLASGLSNMRDWHDEADGQTVYVEEPFNVMDEELMYPGDPAGSPENVINCACTITPVIKEEEITG